MALKMLYRGPSSRLETLIEKIQQNKDTNSGIDQYDQSLLPIDQFLFTMHTHSFDLLAFIQFSNGT